MSRLLSRSLGSLALAVCLLAAPAGAQPRPPAEPGVVFGGLLRAGASTYQARFRFICTASRPPDVTGALSVLLEIPAAAQIRPAFPFDKFEGPDGIGSALTHLRASGVRHRTNNLFPASGSWGDANTFVLTVAASRRDPVALSRLAAIMAPLMEGPGQFLWRQGDGKPNGQFIDASLEVPQAQAAQLNAALAPCMTRP